MSIYRASTAVLPVFIVALHIAVNSILHFPFDLINIAVIALSVLLIAGNLTAAFILALMVGVISDLYALTPFGTLTLSMLCIFWVGGAIARGFLAARSFLGALALTALLTLVYRLCVIAVMFLGRLFGVKSGVLIMQTLLSAITETLITTAAALILILVYQQLTRSKRGKISEKKYAVLG